MVKSEGRIFINTVKECLENINKDVVLLSNLNYKNGKPLKTQEIHFQERPFTYEFYHQCRMREKENSLPFKMGMKLQPEVNKGYQNIKKFGKIPDFILHEPSTTRNFAVVEVKLRNRGIGAIENDFRKLIKFKKRLGYKYAVEIVIGRTRELELLRNHLNVPSNRINQPTHDKGDEIIVFEFDVSLWKVNYYWIPWSDSE